MCKHFAAINEIHAKIDIAVVFERKIQMNNEWITERRQNSLLIQTVSDLLAFDYSFFADNFHCIIFLRFRVLNEFLENNCANY